MLTRLLSATLILAVAVATLGACSDDGAEPGGGDAGPTISLQLQKQPDVVQELDEEAAAALNGAIEVAGADIQFSPNKLALAAGESVTIRVKNSDTVPHNLRIAGLDGEYDTDDDAVTLPETIGNGESGELNFAPLVPGAYTFRCDFHPGSMGGQVVVR
jgi:plastocyanin